MHRLTPLFLSFLLAGPSACTRSDPPPPPPRKPDAGVQLAPRQIVDRAIAAHGGAEALRRGLSAYTMQTRGTFHGMPFSMSTAWQAPNRMVMTMPGMVMGYIGADCWTRVRDVVSPCRTAEARAAREIKAAAHVSSIYPLVGKGVRLNPADAENVEGKPTRAVRVSLRNFEATLYFDGQSGLLRRMRYHGTWGELRGELVSTITAHVEQEGVQLPKRTVVTFRGKEVMVEQLVKARLGSTGGVTTRKRPETVVGQVKVHELPPHLAAFTIHRGGANGIGARTGALMAWMARKNLPPLGPPVLVHLSVHPLRKAMETEIRVTTVGRPGQDGEFGIKGLQASRVAIKVVRGKQQMVVREMHRLMGWARKNRHEIAGPPMTIAHGDPARPDTPTEVCVPIR